MSKDLQLQNLYEMLAEVEQENAIKLEQILDLEQLLWDTRIFDELDGSPCWCCIPAATDYHEGHEDTCIKARKATEPFWKGVKKNDTESN